MVVGGLVAVSMMSMWSQAGMPGFGGMMGGGGMMSGIMSSSWMWGAVGIMSGISAGLGAILIVGGYSIHKKPESSNTWGVAILVTSIVGLITMTGFFIGPIIGIIGGILELTKK